MGGTVGAGNLSSSSLGASVRPPPFVDAAPELDRPGSLEAASVVFAALAGFVSDAFFVADDFAAAEVLVAGALAPLVSVRAGRDGRPLPPC